MSDFKYRESPNWCGCLPSEMCACDPIEKIEELSRGCMELSARCCIAPDGEGLIAGDWGPQCERELKIKQLRADLEAAQEIASDLMITTQADNQVTNQLRDELEAAKEELAALKKEWTNVPDEYENYKDFCAYLLELDSEHCDAFEKVMDERDAAREDAKAYKDSSKDLILEAGRRAKIIEDFENKQIELEAENVRLKGALDKQKCVTCAGWDNTKLPVELSLRDLVITIDRRPNKVNEPS